MPAKNSVLGTSVKSLIRKNKGEKKEFTVGGSGFPNGIEYGKARATSLKLGIYENGTNKGKSYFMVRGVCISPSSVEIEGDTVATAGLQDTLVMEPLFATPTRSRKTEEDHVNYLIWVLQQLGVDTDEMDDNSMEDGTLFSAVIESKPLVKFRTWKSEPSDNYPDPRVNISFQGGAGFEEEEDGSGDDGVDDNTGGTDEPEEAVEEEVATPADPEEDLKEVAELADENEDEEAQAKLMKAAAAVGISEKDATSAVSWDALADSILAATEDSNEDSGGEELEPAKGEIYFFKPPNAKKNIECEVTKVLKRSKIVDLKSVLGDRAFSKVPWGKLSEE